MRILEIKCRPVGPLAQTVLFRAATNCTVIHDENEAGKTALVDIIVNLLFRKSSAQSRFQSRRFEEYDGCIKLECGGEEVSFTGNIDLDRQLGLPPEFSRLPIVRGSDLAFLWSDRRDKKAPLIDACLQHFSSGREENLNTVIKNIRTGAGLTAKRNTWSQAKQTELRMPLELYRQRENLLADLAEKEKLSRKLQEAGGKLQIINRELHENQEHLSQLETERQAALCAGALELTGRLSALDRRYRDGGHERYTQQDAGLWAETEAARQALQEKSDSLQVEIGESEVASGELRNKLEGINTCCREAEAAYLSARAKLASVNEETVRRGQVRANVLGEVRRLTENVKSAAAQREKMRWAYLAVPVLAVAAMILFVTGRRLLGGLTGAILIWVLGWSLAMAATFRKTEREADEKTAQFLREFGLQPPGRFEAAVSCLERYCEEEERKAKQSADDAERACREQEEAYRQLIRERQDLQHRVGTLHENRQRACKELGDRNIKLTAVGRVLQDLITRTGKAGRAELDGALLEKAGIESEITKVRTQLEILLGDEDGWPEKLGLLRPYLDHCPNPRPIEDIERLRGELEAKGGQLQEQERALLAEREALQQQELEASRKLLAAGCEDAAALGRRLAAAEDTLKDAAGRTLAALWAQKVIAAVQEDLEGAILDPLNRTGEIFARITGRYDQISYTRQDTGDGVFRVADGGVEYCEDVLSDGARTQFLLALRLALLEKFLNGAPGFLVLDDPLLNSSDSRKRRAIQVLLDYAGEGWQIFYLTVDGAAPDVFRQLGGDLVTVKRVSDLYI